MKLGRNDLCRCGSGKKYKKCCLAESSRHEQTMRAMSRVVEAKHPCKLCGAAEPDSMGFVPSNGRYIPYTLCKACSELPEDERVARVKEALIEDGQLMDAVA